MEQVPFPPELRHLKPMLDPYMQARMRLFGAAVCRRLNPTLQKEMVEMVLNEAFQMIAQQESAVVLPPRSLRLVLRHDCQSTGCGDMGCVLCQFNPSRLCTRNLKQKYLIDDHLKAKCGAPLRVELVDEAGTCYADGLPPGVQLEMHVLNGEKYKELCPDNTLLSVGQIKTCIISHHTKALLRREGMPEDQLQVYLPLERGQAGVSDLSVTTSSEALLSGKAPTFRLLVWAVDPTGEPVNYVTYVVSESFVVATKRVKHAIKSDIPSINDHISKLLHVGKATVDKLVDLRAALQEEGFDVVLPEELVHVDRVGQFKQLVELSEANTDLKSKLRHVLKLSPEKWEEVCQHALSAVMPDFRNRVWWCQPMRLGLLFSCKSGAVQMEAPTGVVRLGPSKDSAHTVVQIKDISPTEVNAMPKLKQQALQNWYMPGHPNWTVYDSSDPQAASAPIGAALPPQPVPSPTAPVPMPPPALAPSPPQPQPQGPAGAMPGPGGPPGPYMKNMQQSPPGAPGGPGGMGPMGGMQGGYMNPYGGGMMGMPGGPPPPPRVSAGSPFAMMQQPDAQMMGGVDHSRPGGPGMLPPGMMGMQQQAQAQQQQHAALHQHAMQQHQAAMQHHQAAMQQQQQQQHHHHHHQQAQQQAQQQQQQGGPSRQGSARNSAFAANMFIHASIADAFPQFPQPDGAGPSGQQPGHQVGDSSMLNVPSLEMLKTDDLMGRGMSLFENMPSLTTDMRSVDWTNPVQYGMPEMQQLNAHGLHGMPETRNLSMKLNSMSLDLDKVIADHAHDAHPE